MFTLERMKLDIIILLHYCWYKKKNQRNFYVVQNERNVILKFLMCTNK